MAEGPAVKHVYQAPGAYTAKLTVADEKGAADQAGVAIAATPVDSTPPVIAGIDCGDPAKVMATFSKPVEQASAEAAANYTIDQGVRVLSASLGEDRVTVTLATAPLSAGVTTPLVVSNVKDRAKTQRYCRQLAADGVLHRPSGSLETRRGQRRCRRGLFRQRTSWNPQERTAMGCGAARRGLELRRTCQLRGNGHLLLRSGRAAVDCLLGKPRQVPSRQREHPRQPRRLWAGLGMEQQGNNTNAFGFGYGDGTKWQGTGPVKLAADKWQHVTAVCDGQYAILYVNGVEKSKSPAKGPLVPNPDQRFRLGLGYKPDAKRCFHGLLQDVRIYRRALSAAEIARLAGAVKPN